MSAPVNVSPPKAHKPPYKVNHGTRFEKEKASAAPTAFEFPEDPTAIGPWILGECVGKGASGRVKVARHSVTGQLAAVKILPLEALLSSRLSLRTKNAKAQKHRNSIDKEIIMMKLMDHPNIIRIYDVFEGDKELFLILEYVEGGELFDFLVNHGRLDPVKGLCYFKQIIYGLSYAHAFSIIHRDLKPENILVQSINPPRIKIADWGMAAFAPPATQLETSCGSPHYASPEIINGKRYEGTASDIWSCGVILYALMTGRLPFDDPDVRTLLGKVKAGKYEIPSFVHADAADLIRRMLVRDVEKRITMPDILAHPFLQIATPGTTYVPAPSLTELARPLRDPSSIKPEILRSLLVIWGKNAPNTDMMAELTNPPGQGSLIKALYFLLVKYREKTLENYGSNGSFECDVNIRHYSAPPPKVDNTAVAPNESAIIPAVTPTTPSRIRASRVAPAIPTQSPVQSNGSRQWPPSPNGPRQPQSMINPTIPKPATRVRPISTPNTCFSDLDRMVTTHEWNKDLDAAVTPPRLTPVPAARPLPRRAHTMAVDSMPIAPDPLAHRPQLPRLAFDDDDEDLADYELVQFPTSPNAPKRPPPRSSARPESHAVRGGVPWPRIETPAVADAELQRTINDIAGRFNMLCERNNYTVGNAGRVEEAEEANPVLGALTPAQRYAQALRSSHGRANAAGDRVAGPVMGEPDVKDEKENGRRGEVNFEASNNRKAERRKTRPPTIEITAPRSPLIPMSPPLAAAPVVGEVKGWFSNLFNWKAQQYVLYSADNCMTTRDEAARLLASFGVIVMLDEAAMPGNGGVLRCRVDESYDVNTGTVIQKPVRFRVEFSPVLGYIAPPTPRLAPNNVASSPSPPTSDFPSPNLQQYPFMRASGAPPFASTMVLVQEKGALSTLRILYQRLRAEWTGEQLTVPDVGGLGGASGTPVVGLAGKAGR
ncbi:Pkinase-domain-containing protein [Rickenella mellea]|uniref:Pkinase-domain-containing protein n=1 Tax=Rickenella mellea TaxID=50990 RepID=A0A4Y7Q7N2_9AGAM|nr:Pkinase-domain-containing protein [Rickenella mellea]